MNTADAERFIEVELCGRWPDWKPTPAQASDWLFWLRPLTWQQAAAAAREHAAESRYKFPIAAAILQRAKSLAKAAAPEKPKGPTFVTLAAEYLGGCPELTKRRVFYSVPCGPNGKPLKPDQQEQIDKVCQAWLAQLERQYPGARFSVRQT